MVTLQRFEYPTTLDEALSLLAAGRDTVRAIAGGTSLVFFHGRGVEALVDITRLGLDRIWSKDDGITVGACARLHAVSLSPLLRPAGTLAIAEAAAKAGPRALRNAITLGGNVAGYKRWSDLPAPLIACNARVAIAGPEERHLPVAELFGGHPSRLLRTGELLTHFWVPTPPPGTGSAYVKLARTETDYGLASAAARVTLGAEARCRTRPWCSAPWATSRSRCPGSGSCSTRAPGTCPSTRCRSASPSRSSRPRTCAPRRRT